jgi:hypothetical protein
MARIKVKKSKILGVRQDLDDHGIIKSTPSYYSFGYINEDASKKPCEKSIAVDIFKSGYSANINIKEFREMLDEAEAEILKLKPTDELILNFRQEPGYEGDTYIKCSLDSYNLETKDEFEARLKWQEEQKAKHIKMLEVQLERLKSGTK